MTGIEWDAERIRSRRRGYLALSAFVLLFLGLIYAFSMFARPMTQDFGLTGNVGLTFNIMMIAFCTGSVVGSLIDRKFGVRVPLILTAVMFAIGFGGAGILGNAIGDVVVLYIFYGLIGGFSVGIGYNTIIATTNVWFPDKVGFSSGVLMMGFGLSSLIFGNVALQLRPLLGGMGTVLTVLGVFVAILTLVLAFVLQRPPANIVEVMTGEKPKQAVGTEPEAHENIFKTPIFYAYYFFAVIILAIGLTTIGSVASDAMRVGIEEGFASLLVGFVSTANGLSRIVIGILFDKTNIKVTMLVDGLIAVCATVLIVGAFALDSAALYIPGALLVGCAYGGQPVISSTFARKRYGASRYAFNLSVVNVAVAFGSLLSICVTSIIGLDARLSIFIAMMVLSFIALFAVFLFSRLWKRDMEQGRS